MISRKASPAYFKSRMSSFLNPLFLGSIATLFLLAFVVWQFVLQPNQLAGNPNSSETEVDTANNPAIGAEGIENADAAQNDDSLEEETIDRGFLSQTTTGKEILQPISPSSAAQQQQNRASRLYDQIVGLNLFPDLLPNQGGVNDPIGNTSGVNVPPQYSQYATRYGQYYQPRGGVSAPAQTGPTPLAAAVNQVMANSNYNRYVRQVPAQTQTSVRPTTANAPNLNFPGIAPTYGGASAYAPTYGASAYGTAPIYGAPSAYGTAPTYGAPSAYGTAPTYGGASAYAPSYGTPTYGNQSFGYYGGGY